MLSAWLWQRRTDNKFDLLDLVNGGDGRLSLGKTGQLVALLVSTWGFVALTRAGELTEWYFLAYMATWTGVGVARQFIGAKAQRQSGETLEKDKL